MKLYYSCSVNYLGIKGGILIVLCTCSLFFVILILYLLLQKRFRNNVIHKLNIVLYFTFVLLYIKKFIQIYALFTSNNFTYILRFCQFSIFIEKYITIQITFILSLMAIYRYIAFKFPIYFQSLKNFIVYHIIFTITITIVIIVPITLQTSIKKINTHNVSYYFNVYI